MSPIRRALKADSALQKRTRDGLNALEKRHRLLIEDSIKRRFQDSLDLDAAFTPEHANENRWDSVLGDGKKSQLVGLEPHSAKAGEVSTVIRKKQKALEQLKGHLRPGKSVRRWFWVSPGAVQFPVLDRVQLQLAQENIRFVGEQLLAKHLA